MANGPLLCRSGDHELSPAFEGFRGWLRELRLHFSEGFASNGTCARRMLWIVSSASDLVLFDDETLGAGSTIPASSSQHVTWNESLKGPTFATIPNHLRFWPRLMQPKLTLLESTPTDTACLPVLPRFIYCLPTSICLKLSAQAFVIYTLDSMSDINALRQE